MAGVLGLVDSPWGSSRSRAVLIGFAFAGMGIAATTFMRTWQDFELIGLVQLPLFLFSATFFPISTYPEAPVVVRCSPLYNAIPLLRALECSAIVGLGAVRQRRPISRLRGGRPHVARRRIGKLLLK